MSLLADLATAVVAKLNAGSYTRPFTARRAYQPVHELEDLATLQVTVVPRALEPSLAARGTRTRDVTVEIGVQQQVDPASLPAVDALVTLVEELVDDLEGQRLPDYPNAAFVSLTSEPIAAAEHLREKRVFTALIAVTYRAWSA